MSFLLDYNPGTQQWGYPRRGASLSGTCIIHTAECAMDLDGDDTSAEVCANFIANRRDYGSYHRLVDSDSIIDMVPFEYEAWQDSETNPWAVGISAAVQAGKWHVIPADRRDRIYRNMACAAAEFVTYMASKGVTVPLRRITGAEARARKPGFCAHGDSGVHRSDPGAQFDWGLFFTYTQQALGSGAIGPQEDELSKAAEQDIARIREILEAGEADNTRARIRAIDDRTALLVSDIRYLKGADDPTLYERMEDGRLRGITEAEWRVTGLPYIVKPQHEIDVLPKAE